MKKLLLASACILALSAGGVSAQTQPAPGASSEGNVGPGATKGMKKDMTTGTGTSSQGMSGQGMSGQTGGTAANPSSEGNVGPGTNNNNNNPGMQPGRR